MTLSVQAPNLMRVESAGDPAEQAISRARLLDNKLHAFVDILPQAAPTLPGPLGGLPYALKDLANTRGRAPSLGLAFPPNPAADVDAAVVSRMAQAGARLIGFTTMTELAYEPSGANAARGRAINPWQADHICGGSSSGSAVAVAAGIVPVALGSDTGGSLRIPAHCCGVSAWKPSIGLVPAAGTMTLAGSLDCLGFVGRSVADLAAVAQVFTPPAASAPITRIAVARDVTGECDRDIALAVQDMEGVLASIGITRAPTALLPLIAACDPPVMTLMQGEAAREMRPLMGSGRLDRVMQARLAKGVDITDAQLTAARATLADLGRTMFADMLGTADAVLLPVMRIRTPHVAVCEPGTPHFSPRTLYQLSALTRWVNGLGLPAVAIPVGLDSGGLPIAVQLVGRPGQDAALLALAAEIQKHSEWHLRMPGFLGVSA